MAFVHKPRLWFSTADVDMIRGRVSAGDPTAAGVAAAARAVADQPLNPGAGKAAAGLAGNRFAECCAITYLLTGEKAYARKAHDYLVAAAAEWPTGDLAKGTLGLYGAIAHECCYDGWDAGQRVRMTRLLYKLAMAAHETQTNVGDPHTVTNNHWAVVHAGAALAAMAAHGHPHDAAGHRLDMTDEILYSGGRVKAFIGIHGDQCGYHEGIGYLGYPAGHWLPFMAADERLAAAGEPAGENLIETFPHVRNLAATLYSVACARPTLSDETYDRDGRWGMKLSWNDDGLGWISGGVNPLAVHFAHARQKGALRWMFDRLNGHLAGGDPAERFCPGFGGHFFTLLYYPYDVPPADPNGTLPRHVTDHRQGLVVFRNRYRDGHDAILGAYAKCQAPGGHQQEDAGSVRFMALGYDWIMGGGQARGKAAWQSVVTPVWNDKTPRPGATHALGAIMWDAQRAGGGAFGMDLRKVSVGYHERFVAVDFGEDGDKTRPAAVVALLDQIDDHAGRTWLWNLTFSPLLTFAAHRDGAGFDLTALDGTGATLRFLGVTPTSLSLEKMPDSQRTYQGEGTAHTYPGRPFVQAQFGPREDLTIYAVMAVQPAGAGAAPPIELLAGADVRIGKFTWTRPFGAALPAAFTPGASGSLCKFSGGTRTFTAQAAADALGPAS